ncbi:MAG: lipopolysaccharide biosynthesis protein [Solirubrobacteraceae bacterium]
MPATEHEAAVRAAVSKLFGRDMAYVAAWAAQVVLTALMTPALTRLMPTSQYGTAMAATAVMQIQYVILGFGLSTGTQRAFAQESEDLARRVVAVAALLAVAGGAAFYWTGHWWAPLIGAARFSLPFRYATIWAVLSALTTTPLGLVRARDQLRWFIAVSLAQTVFAQLLAVMFVVIDHGSSSGYMLGEVAGQVTAATVVLSVARPKWIGRAFGTALTTTVRFSLALVPAAIAGFVIGDSDRIIVKSELGATALGRYAVAANVGGFVALGLGALAGIWISRLFAIEDKRVLYDVVGRGRDGLGQLAAGAALALAAAAPILLELWCPPRYRPDSLLLVATLVAVQAVPTAIGEVYTQTMLVHGRAKTVAAFSVATATLNILLNLLLIPAFGINGSAAASLIDLTCWALLYHAVLGRDRPPLRLRSVLLVAAAVALSIASANIAPSGWMLAARLVVAVTALAFCAVLLLSLVAPDRHAQLRGRLPWVTV